MINRLRFLILLVTPLLLLSSITARGLSQSTGTGGTIEGPNGLVIEGEFADFYNQADDPSLIFGDVLSNEEDHPVYPGVRVQSFMRARMEYWPNEEEGHRIHLAPLGAWLSEKTYGEPVNWPFTPGACRLIGSRNIAVCFEFLKFYDEHNGPVFFGEPISPQMKLINGRLVQYFEYSRMEWWPENPPEARVVLSPVGKMDSDDKPWPKPTSVPGPNQQIFSLTINAFPARPFVASNSQQTINVIVRNQVAQAVSGVLVKLAVHTPDGQVINLRLPETDAQGLTQTKIDVGPYKPGQVVTVDVEAEIGTGVSASASTYFRVWW